uniref:Uncharacterized protein n=1 Tax=Rhizophora mucronata TaxID=61149 RepID=A0A2P2N951_RHIMU
MKISFSVPTCAQTLDLAVCQVVTRKVSISNCEDS